KILAPFLLWHPTDPYQSHVILAEVPFDLNKGKLDKEHRWVVLEDEQMIPGSNHRLKLRESATQISYGANSRYLLVAQRGQFHQLTTTDSKGRFTQAALRGKYLSPVGPAAGGKKDDGSFTASMFGAGQFGKLWQALRPLFYPDN